MTWQTPQLIMLESSKLADWWLDTGLGLDEVVDEFVNRLLPRSAE